MGGAGGKEGGASVREGRAVLYNAQDVSASEIDIRGCQAYVLYSKEAYYARILFAYYANALKSVQMCLVRISKTGLIHPKRIN